MKTALTAIMTALVMTTPVAAQDVCMSALEIQSSLIDWYGEKASIGAVSRQHASLGLRCNRVLDSCADPI